MRFPMRTAPILAGLLAMAASSARAQEGYVAPASVVSGMQGRQYSFERGLATKWVRQFAFPGAVVFPVGQRLSVDIGSNYAVTTIKDSTGRETTLSGFTDTQIRASYVFGKDAVVTTLLINLPTGQKSDTSFLFGSIAGNFLLFPVNSYRNGASATGGLAAAFQMGGWNLGAAGSVRLNAEYKPFNGAAFKYKPGVEGRFRLGVDRLVGSSRLAVGFTYSTFANDEGRSGTGAGTFQPGNRYIAEASLTTPVPGGSVTGYLWNFYRDSKSTSSRQEDVLTGGVSANLSLGRGVGLEPAVEAKLWHPDQGRGNLLGVGTTLRLDLAPKLSFAPGGRFDFGRRRNGAANYSHIRGWQISGLLRYTI
ncbi:MAG: hypothetical protein ACREMO_00195 [Gemmatimonadales bacterium]